MQLVQQIAIPAASLQACVAGHAYWIGQGGALVDAGTNIAAANPTNQPPLVLDVSGYTNAQWSVFYGAQTGQVGGKLAMAELWPASPVEAAGTIPPYVRDAASYWLNTSGSGMVIQQRIPADYDVLYDLTSAANATLDTGSLITEDYEALTAFAAASGGTTQLVATLVRDDAGGPGSVAITAGASQQLSWGIGVGGSSFAAQAANVGSMVPRRVDFTTSAAGLGNTVRLIVMGQRKRPLRRIQRIAPYIQFATPPSPASPIYLDITVQRDAFPAV